MFKFKDYLYAMIGVPIPFPGATPPPGYVMMVGQAIDPVAHPILRMRYGNNLPDLRGEFIRGWDNGRGVDNGRGLLSWQEGASGGLAAVQSINLMWSSNLFYQDVPQNGEWSNWLQSGEESAGSAHAHIRFRNTGGDSKPRNYSFNYICLAG